MNFSGPAAVAQAGGTAEKSAIVHAVLLASDPAKAFSALAAHDQIVFSSAFADQDEIATESVPVQVASAVDGSAVVPSNTIPGGGGGGAGCWQKYVYHEWYDFKIHDGNTWMQLNWCNDLYGNVTSSSVTNVGGQGLAGVGYGGIIGSGSRTIFGQIRVFREFKFTLALASANPCMQVRGNAGGTSTFSISCNLS